MRCHRTLARRSEEQTTTGKTENSNRPAHKGPKGRPGGSRSAPREFGRLRKRTVRSPTGSSTTAQPAGTPGVGSLVRFLFHRHFPSCRTPRLVEADGFGWILRGAVLISNNKPKTRFDIPSAGRNDSVHENNRVTFCVVPCSRPDRPGRFEPGGNPVEGYQRQGYFTQVLPGSGPARGERRLQVRLHPAIQSTRSHLSKIQRQGLCRPRYSLQRSPCPRTRHRRGDHGVLLEQIPGHLPSI